MQRLRKMLTLLNRQTKMKMKKVFAIGLLAALLLFSCAEDEQGKVENSISLLVSTTYNANPNYTFEYNENYQLTKCTTNGGVEVKEYYYNENGQFTGFKEVSQSNAVYPIRRFTVDVNTANEISGSFNLYDPNDVLDPAQGSRIRYELEEGLIKKYSEIHGNGNDWEKSFEHNNAGDLTAIQLFENAESGHLHRMEFTQWDDKDETNIFASLLQTYPAMDLIPGIKLSNHNFLNVSRLIAGNNSPAVFGSFLHEYNDYGQITRIYTLTADSFNEEGEIVVMGGEEVTLATFEYMVIDL